MRHMASVPYRNYTPKSKASKYHKNEKYVSLAIAVIGLVGIGTTLLLGWKTYMM